jgi:hypothetical protein
MAIIAGFESFGPQRCCVQCYWGQELVQPTHTKLIHSKRRINGSMEGRTSYEEEASIAIDFNEIYLDNQVKDFEEALHEVTLSQQTSASASSKDYHISASMASPVTQSILHLNTSLLDKSFALDDVYDEKIGFEAPESEAEVTSNSNVEAPVEEKLVIDNSQGIMKNLSQFSRISPVNQPLDVRSQSARTSVTSPLLSIPHIITPRTTTAMEVLNEEEEKHELEVKNREEKYFTFDQIPEEQNQAMAADSQPSTNHEKKRPNSLP